MNMVYVWLIVAVLAVIAEALTVQMVAIWFAPAALVAMVSAIFGAPLMVQLVLFVALRHFVWRFCTKNCAKTLPRTAARPISMPSSA